jgi:hypothetical protein
MLGDQIQLQELRYGIFGVTKVVESDSVVQIDVSHHVFVQ